MSTSWPVGNIPYVAVQEGGRRVRAARPHIPPRSGAVQVLGGSQNIAADGSLASAMATGANVTCTGGVAAPGTVAYAPDGWLYGIRALETAVNATHWPRWLTALSVLTPPSTISCASVYVKANGRSRGRLEISPAGDFSSGVLSVEFDLSAQTIAYVNAGSVALIAGMGIEPAGGSWFRVHIAAQLEFRAARVLFMDGSGNTSYLGVITNGMDLWAPQIEVNATEPSAPLLTGSMPSAPDAVNRNALMVPYDLTQSGFWTLVNTTVSLVPTERAPGGHLCSAQLLETTANAQHGIEQTLATGITGVVCGSVYIRPHATSGGRDAYLQIDSTGTSEWAAVGVNLDALSTASLGGPVSFANTSGGGVSVLDYGVQYLEDGWLRVWVVARSATASWNVLRIRATTTAGVTSYTGVVTAGLRLLHPELVTGHAPTAAAMLPEFPPAALTDNGVRVTLPPNGNAAAYADLIAISRSVYWEVTVVTMTTDGARIGLVTPAASSMDGQNLGSVANTWALLPNGDVQSSGVNVGSGPTYAAGDTIGVLLLWNAGTSRYGVHFVKNPAGAFALPAASVAAILNTKVPAYGRVGSTTTVTLDVNLGQRAFKGIPPAEFFGLTADLADSVRSFSTASLPVIDTVNYRSTHQATLPAYPLARGRLATRPVIRRAVTCWPWGRGQRSQTPGATVELDNSDGTLDEFASYASRDRIIGLHMLRGAPFATANTGNRGATVLLDAVRSEGGRVTLSTRDVRELLAVPLQTTTFPTTVANTAVHGKPRPITIGNVRWVPVVMRDGPNLDFEFHDSASFAQLVELRQNGALLTLTTDYVTPGAGGAFGFRRVTAVQGKQAARVRGQVDGGAALIERLPALMTWLAVTKTARLTAGQLDTAGTIAALDTAAPYTLARYIGPDEPLTALQLAQEALDSFCGDVYTGPDGVLRVWRLEAPAGTPAFRWTEDDLASEIVRTPDTAPGLTTTIGFARNFAPHSTGELAGAVQNTTLGSELSLPFQSRTATPPLADGYRQASGAPPMVTLLTDGTQAQTEINRVAAIYSVPRFFYEARVLLSAADVIALNPGTTVFLQAPTADLAAGKLLEVVAVEAELGVNVATLRLWG